MLDGYSGTTKKVAWMVINLEEPTYVLVCTYKERGFEAIVKAFDACKDKFDEGHFSQKRRLLFHIATLAGDEGCINAEFWARYHRMHPVFTDLVEDTLLHEEKVEVISGGVDAVIKVYL